MLVVARVLVIVRCQAFAYLHDREHATHLDRPELAEARHHRQRVVGHRHFHLAHHRHSLRAHRHVVGDELTDLPGEVALLYADEVPDIVTHRVHGVVRLVTVERPVARVVGNHVEGPDHADRDIDGAFRPLRTLGHPSAVRAAHREMVAVQMDRVVGHGEIAHAHAHAVAEPHRHRIDAGKHAAVPGPHVEVGHLRDLRQIGPGIDQVGAHDEHEVAIDAAKFRVARVNDEHAHHAHRHLHHLVRVGVVHERAALLHFELVDEGLSWLDVRLRHPADPVHSVRQQHAVPVHG